MSKIFTQNSFVHPYDRIGMKSNEPELQPCPVDTIESLESLQAWLVHHKIPIHRWGEGNAKTVQELWIELTRGETQLWASPPLRVINVVRMYIRSSSASDSLLYEVEQTLPDGRNRPRNTLPGEKMIGDELPRATASRLLQEEFNMPADCLEIARISDQPHIEEKTSPSYPGLTTRYCFYDAEIIVSGLPDEPFWTEEVDEEGQVLRHRWEWANGKRE